jgi:lysophospholipase L1-like esterase
MPFGDPITDGYNQDTPGGYRVELFRLAHSAGKNIDFVGSGSNGPEKVDGVAFPHNHEGHSGWTIAPAGGRSGISTLVSMVMPQHKPEIVLLMIGTNDAIDNFEMAKASTRLGALIDAIYAELPNVLIVVASLIPARGDRGQGDDAELNARIESFNASLPALIEMRAAAGKHIALVDMHKLFGADARPLLEDQWHPNLQGYQRIGAEWFKALQPLL